MFPKRFALIGGIVMVAMGGLALIPDLVGSTRGLPLLNLENSYGLFLGYFPMNIVNKMALILIGLLGIGAASSRFTSLPMSIHFSRLVLFIMAPLAILGLFPQTNTLFGYWPLFGGEVVAHSIFALAGAYFGYALSAKVPNSGPALKTFTTPLAR